MWSGSAAQLQPIEVRLEHGMAPSSKRKRHSVASNRIREPQLRHWVCSKNTRSLQRGHCSRLMRLPRFDTENLVRQRGRRDWFRQPSLLFRPVRMRWKTRQVRRLGTFEGRTRFFRLGADQPSRISWLETSTTRPPSTTNRLPRHIVLPQNITARATTPRAKNTRRVRSNTLRPLTNTPMTRTPKVSSRSKMKAGVTAGLFSSFERKLLAVARWVSPSRWNTLD